MTQEYKHHLSVWTLSIFGFVSETSSSLAFGSAQGAMYDLHDDVIRAVLVDHTFGGAVDNSIFIPRPRQAGLIPTAALKEQYGEFEIGLELWQTVDYDSLAPGSGRSLSIATTAVIDRLKGITGAPDYRNDLEGRVFNKLWTPEDGKSKLPYLCVVTTDDAARYD